MSSNDVTISEDADMAECDGEKVVTMMDVLQEQQEFEDDANAVLGASDDKNCTFQKGYIKRQALYACLTCCPDARTDHTKRAGVCLACSLNCHENHELVELYTKRNFRCDCGNPKFNTHPCQFTPNKPDLNEENSYNQNFSGLYCTCHRPYPDPESTFEDEMIQCIICEDWLHASHLEATLPSNEQYAEMVCKACMEKNEFLHDYSDIAVSNEAADVDVTSVNTTETAKTTTESDTPKVNGTLGATEVSERSDKEINKTNDIEMTETEKVELTKENEKIEEGKETIAPNTTDENKTDMPNSETKSNAEDASITHAQNDSTPSENENKDSISEVAKDDSPEKKETNHSMENKTEPSAAEDAVEKNVNNDNSIIESIEKLEGELGKEEPRDKVEDKETKSDNTDNDKDKTESKDENSITPDAESDKQDLKTNDITMNEDKEARTETEAIVNDAEKPDHSLNGDSKLLDEPEDDLTANKEDATNESKRKLSTEESDDIVTKKPKLEASGCTRPRGVKKIFKGATFWPSNFRQKLCTCNECISMYKDLSVLFLTDLEDTVTAYEALGKQRTDGSASSQYEKGLEALSSLDRIQQINALTEYNKMRDKLLDFLKSFKDRKEVVKEEDIKAFFAGMKPKREPDGVYFCR